MSLQDIWVFLRDGGLAAGLVLFIALLVNGRFRLGREVTDLQAAHKEQMVDKDRQIVAQAVVIDRQNARIDALQDELVEAVRVTGQAVDKLPAHRG